MPDAPLWEVMDRMPRRSMRELRAADIPSSAGVYALYREGERMYVGKAGCLRDRVWKNHSGRGAVMTSSAMRRNLAEHLGIATAADIKGRRYQPAPDEVARVRDWLDGCEVTWRECSDETAAVALEAAMKAERRPPLTKR
jgi:predicted GIY-YIG superfamily endonuclease